MNRFLMVALALWAFFYAPVSSFAAASCYTMEEAEAEQGIRIHSELMVIGLNCQHMKFSDGTNLYLEYREFTKEHENLFSGYEDTLIGYFEKQGKDPEASVNTMRTDFANKISGDVAKMRPDQFCNRYASRILKVADFKEDDIRRWATTFYPSHPVTHPVCEN